MAEGGGGGGGSDQGVRRQLALVVVYGSIGILGIVLLGAVLGAVDIGEVRSLIESVWAFIGPMLGYVFGYYFGGGGQAGMQRAGPSE